MNKSKDIPSKIRITSLWPPCLECSRGVAWGRHGAARGGGPLSYRNIIAQETPHPGMITKRKRSQSTLAPQVECGFIYLFLSL
ncbi:MAG: hypothetical protein RR980_03655 [Mucinivorans sp.]